MHSPFVFDFITKVLNDKTQYPAYRCVEDLRKKLLLNSSVLPIEDFGAGSSTTKKRERSIASIAKNAAKPPKFGQLLYRIVNHYRPRIVLELGTSLGITTSYLALGNPRAELTTLEGATAVAGTASQNITTLQLTNVRIVTGNFDNTLPTVIEPLTSVDLAFIDGNHRQEPTERYFRQLLPLANNDTLLIFDDIHWSAEMELAWETIRQHPSVRCTIDLFFIGIVLFRQEFKEKQHFAIRF